MTALRHLLAVLALLLVAPGAMAAALQDLQVAQAVRGGWDDAAPPADGWQDVKVPDAWGQRWPTHDGVVWYRLRWRQDGTEPTGLLLHYVIMAGEMRLNGSLLHRDESLVEPVTRAWNTPRHWLLAPPLLRAGENELLLRVSGAAAHQSGLGPVVVGPPELVEHLYLRERLLRYDLQLVSLSVAATITAFFFILWLFRREATVYGWFALMEGSWLLVGVNQVARTPWPLPTNDAWHILNTVAILFFAGSMCTFLLRLCGQHRPRLERGLWLFAALGTAWMLVAPYALLYPSRALLLLASAIVVWTGCIAYAVAGWRSGQMDQRALALCTMSMVVVSGHDVLVFLQVIKTNLYYGSMATHVMTIGMAVVLAWRFVQSLRRIEGFNAELQARIDDARAELAATLQREHVLEVSHARLAERVNLARDLHDGLGGTLVGSIAALEHDPEKATAPALLDVLKGLRDDLRLIVDASAQQHGGSAALVDLLAPVRRRLAQLLEASGIACRWTGTGLEEVRLPPSQGLDVLRFLQEALTNVLKHSRATQVRVDVHAHEGILAIEIEDDGVGLLDIPKDGIGLRSMQARADRLRGELRIESTGSGTRVSLRVPLPQGVAA
jgi:signal transduction histidine kinase